MIEDMKLQKITLKQWVIAASAATVGVIVLGICRGDTALSRYWQLYESRALLEKTVEALHQENTKLNEEVVRLKESPAYARKVLRDKYHVTDPDEDIVFFAE